MNDHLECPGPFIFNAIKHHIAYIRYFIDQARSGIMGPEDINLQMVKIGRSMIDIYLGELTPFAISKEIKSYLESIKCFDSKSFNQFISSSTKKFRNITLRDGSSWTLLIGDEEERFIHIHPSRGSKYTLRIGAMALKTAIYLRIYYPAARHDSPLVKLVNAVREQLMKEAPIQNESYTKGLRRVLNLF